MNKDGQVFWSSDEETFNYDSLDELIAMDDDLEAGRTVYYGEAEAIGTNFVDADDVIEDIANRAYDEGGEHAEDFPDVSAEAKKELDDFLTAWQAKYCVPTFYRIRNVKEYTITQADIDAVLNPHLATRSPTQ